MFGIPNFWNVFSNLPFFFIGLWGLYISAAPASPRTFLSRAEQWSYMTLFLGVTLTCFGSSYYHWSPDNASLVWDRLPMTFGFMGLLAATLCERIKVSLGRALLLPLVILGILSVFYWQLTEVSGRGDLRLYVLVQFGALLLIVTMTLIYAPRYSHSLWIFGTIIFYTIAKFCESYDREIYNHLGTMSGHAFKHVAAAAALVPIIFMLGKREPLENLSNLSFHSNA